MSEKNNTPKSQAKLKVLFNEPKTVEDLILLALAKGAEEVEEESSSERGGGTRPPFDEIQCIFSF